MTWRTSLVRRGCNLALASALLAPWSPNLTGSTAVAALSDLERRAMPEAADAPFRRRPLGVHADPYFVYTLGEVIDKPPRWAPGTLPPRQVTVPDELALRYSRLMGEFWDLQRELRALFDHAPTGGDALLSHGAPEHSTRR